MKLSQKPSNQNIYPKDILNYDSPERELSFPREKQQRHPETREGLKTYWIGPIYVLVKVFNETTHQLISVSILPPHKNWCGSCIGTESLNPKPNSYGHNN